jgi:radical SAM protein with 4Fe4S-binding SPASM domain
VNEDEKKILRSTELTGVIGREEMDKLSQVYGDDAWSAYRNSYDKAANLEISDYPIQLDIELNASCNLRCPMCPISAESPKGKGKSTWFSYELYKEIIDESVKNGLKALKLNYINEPLIRDDLFKFVDYAKEAGVLDIYLSTNGMLMTPEVCKRMVSSGLTRVQVSIDAVTEEIYDKLRPGGKLPTVIKNIEHLLEAKNEAKSITPLIRVNFVRTEINEDQLPAFIEQWKGKVDMIGIQEFIKPTMSSMEIKSKTSTDKRKEGFRCSFPFKQLVITNEHMVLPCCTFWGEQLPVGKITSASQIKEIWHGEKINWLRDMHQAGRYNEIPQCQNCVEGGVE